LHAINQGLIAGEDNVSVRIHLSNKCLYYESPQNPLLNKATCLVQEQKGCQRSGRLSERLAERDGNAADLNLA